MLSFSLYLRKVCSQTTSGPFHFLCIGVYIAQPQLPLDGSAVHSHFGAATSRERSTVTAVVVLPGGGGNGGAPVGQTVIFTWRPCACALGRLEDRPSVRPAKVPWTRFTSGANDVPPTRQQFYPEWAIRLQDCYFKRPDKPLNTT